MVGELPPSPDFHRPGGKQWCTLTPEDLRSQRAERNSYVISKVKPSEWSNDLWSSTVADASEGCMSAPIFVEQLDLTSASLTRRLPIREERAKGVRTRPVDHFTESGINPATHPKDAIMHETVDHFLALLLLSLTLGMSPRMWKRDVAQAFRKVPINHESVDPAWVTFEHLGKVSF